MPNAEQLLWAVPLLPLLGALCFALMGGKLRRYSHLPCVLGAALSSVVSIMLVLSLPELNSYMHTQEMTWFEVGPVERQSRLGARSAFGHHVARHHIHRHLDRRLLRRLHARRRGLHALLRHCQSFPFCHDAVGAGR